MAVERQRYPGRSKGSAYLRLETDVELRKRCLAKWGHDDDFAASIRTARGRDLDKAAEVLLLTRRIVEDFT